MTADAAVQIALINNRGLQAVYAELAQAEARMVEASLPPNPTFSIERLAGPVEIEIERRIVANILALATLPARAEVAGVRFRQAQLRAAEETLRLAAETKRSPAGSACGAAISTSSCPLRFPRCRGGRRCLPESKSRRCAAASICRSRMELDALAKSFGLTQATRFINLVEITGIKRTKIERETGRAIHDRGFEVELQIPLFDFGETRVRQAEATYMEAANRLIERAVNVRSEARDACRVYRSAYDIAGHYRREVLPLRKIISDETLLRYNAMQIDVFALLTEARQRIAATIAAMDAQRDFWLASTNLRAAVAGGGSAGGGAAEPARPMAEADGEGRH